MAPRYSSAELFEKLLRFWESGDRFHSLVRENKYRITRIEQHVRTYDILYESGKIRTVPFDDLYAIYVELYRIGRMARTYLREGSNCQRIVGHEKYTHAPGATLYALLPCLDNAIDVEQGGHLAIRQT